MLVAGRHPCFRRQLTDSRGPDLCRPERNAENLVWFRLRRIRVAWGANPGFMSEAESVRQTLEGVLGELRDEGALDSSGEFTLDPTKALEKMRKFQVQNPDQYILWLAAAAILGKATQMLVTRGVDRICVEFDGQEIQRGELELLLQDGAQQRPGRVGHLAFALTAALSMRPQEVIVESSDQRLQIRGRQAELSHLSGEASPRIRIVILGPQNYQQKWDLPELNVLKDRVPSTLLKVMVNDRNHSSDWHGGDLVHGLQYWQGEISSDRLRPFLERPVHTSHRHGGAFSALISLDTWRRQSQADLQFLYDGLLFPVSMPFPFAFRALIDWPDLKLDLSRSKIVESPTYSEILQKLAGMAMETARSFVAGYADLKPELRSVSERWLVTLADHWKSESNFDQLRTCQHWLEAYHRPGIWLERQEPVKLIKEMLQRLPEVPVPVPEVAPPVESGFWSWLKGTLSGSSSQEQSGSLDSLKISMEIRKKWKQIVSDLLEHFDPDSSFRIGFAAQSPDPEWLTLEGVLPDGSRLLLNADDQRVRISLYYPSGWAPRAQQAPLTPPAGWSTSVEEGPPWTIDFRSQQSWKDPTCLVALVGCLLDSRRTAQSQESLPCPGCQAAMEKIVLDVVLDRCDACQGLWLDYAELEWLMKNELHHSLQPPPGEGLCPRCRLSLRPGGRNKAGAECPRCRGTWFLAPGPLISPADAALKRLLDSP